MPSSTFSRLPVEKQNRLLGAATKEFSQKPYSEASINQIIRDAGIPRGSFYMYFTDKEELFRYVLQGYVDQLLQLLELCILEETGDVFAGFLRLFDYIRSQNREQSLGSVGAMTAIIGCNSGMQKNVLLEMLDRERLLKRLRNAVNPELLDLRTPEDLADVLAILLSVGGSLLYDGLQRPEDAAVRQQLVRSLRIFQHGMARDKESMVL